MYSERALTKKSQLSDSYNFCMADVYISLSAVKESKKLKTFILPVYFVLSFFYSRSSNFNFLSLLRCLDQGWQNFFGERAKTLKIKFSKLMVPLH